jgi:hypothetical protein
MTNKKVTILIFVTFIILIFVNSAFPSNILDIILKLSVILIIILFEFSSFYKEIKKKENKIILIKSLIVSLVFQTVFFSHNFEIIMLSNQLFFAVSLFSIIPLIILFAKK